MNVKTPSSFQLKSRAFDFQFAASGTVPKRLHRSFGLEQATRAQAYVCAKENTLRFMSVRAPVHEPVQTCFAVPIVAPLPAIPRIRIVGITAAGADLHAEAFVGMAGEHVAIAVETLRHTALRIEGVAGASVSDVILGSFIGRSGYKGITTEAYLHFWLCGTMAYAGQHPAGE